MNHCNQQTASHVTALSLSKDADPAKCTNNKSHENLLITESAPYTNPEHPTCLIASNTCIVVDHENLVPDDYHTGDEMLNDEWNRSMNRAEDMWLRYESCKDDTCYETYYQLNQMMQQDWVRNTREIQPIIDVSTMAQVIPTTPHHQSMSDGVVSQQSLQTSTSLAVNDPQQSLSLHNDTSLSLQDATMINLFAEIADNTQMSQSCSHDDKTEKWRQHQLQ